MNPKLMTEEELAALNALAEQHRGGLLSKRESAILRLRAQSYTLKGVAEMMEKYGGTRISRQRVYQMEQRAMGKLQAAGALIEEKEKTCE